MFACAKIHIDIISFFLIISKEEDILEKFQVNFIKLFAKYSQIIHKIGV